MFIKGRYFINPVKITVKSETEQAKRELDNLTSSVSKISTPLSAATSGLAKIGLLAAGIAATAKAVKVLVDKSKEYIDLYKIQEQAEVRLEASLKATKNAVGMSSDELKNLASSLQNVTTTGDETIIQMEMLFVATKSVSKDILPQATKSALNLSKALGTDAVSSAQKLARVLADPAKNLEALKESNIQLTQAQKDQILSLQEQGDLLSAQNIVLSAVESAYGGVAEAVANTDTGKIEQIQNLMDDIKEGLGQAIVGSLSPAFDWMKERLTEINDGIQWINEHSKASKVADTLLDGKSTGKRIFDYTDLELETAVDRSQYHEWYSNKLWNNELLSPAETPTQELIDRAIERGEFTKSDMEAFDVVIQEIERRKKEKEKNELTKDNYSLLDEKLSFKNSGQKTSTQAIILPVVNKELETERNEKAKTEKERTDSVSSNVSTFLKNNASLSHSKKIEDIQTKITEAQSMRWNASGEQKLQIEEIISSLEVQKNELLKIKEITEDTVDEDKIKTEAAEKLAETLSNISSITSEISSPLLSIGSSIADIFTSAADSAVAELERITNAWDKYFEDLDKKQSTQKDSLSMALSEGVISYDEYIKSRQSMDDAYTEAQQAKAKEEEDARKKADRLKEAAFNADKANSLAQIGIDTAMAIMNVWANHGGNPILAGVLTGLVSSASLMQISAVASKQYTPLAAGGIITKPTYALLGEGGSKEAVLPLNSDTFKKTGLSGNEGTVILNFNFGNVYSKEELVSDVFESVEKLQRIGSLPKWKYANV